MPCEYSQAQYDDFQWEQVRIHPGTRAPADLPHGEPTLNHHSPFISFQGHATHLLCYPGYTAQSFWASICFGICNDTDDTVNMELSEP